MNKYYKLRRYFTLYNTFKEASNLYWSSVDYYDIGKSDLFETIINECLNRINIYAEVMEDDEIFDKIKAKDYFNLNLYHLLVEYIKTNEYDSNIDYCINSVLYSDVN